MRALLPILVAIVGMPAAALYSCDRLENPQREYATLTDDVFLGGWVPRLLPPAATAIRTQHNVDTNEVWVRFKVGTPDFEPAKLGFRQVSAASWLSQVRQPRHASWWFKSLSKFPPRSAKLYVGACRDPGFSVPVRSGNMLLVAGEAYFWCGAESAT